MHRRHETPQKLIALAGDQGGVLTYAQALGGLGRTPLRRLVSSGAWVGVTPGIVSTVPVVSDEGRFWAGHLLGGSASALGGLAALSLDGVVPAPDAVDIWVPNGRNKGDRAGWAFRQDALGRLDRTLGSLPRIRAEEALIDVGQLQDVEGWVTLLADAVRLRVVSLKEVAARIDRRPKVAQRTMLRAVVDDLSGVESALEWVYLRDVERAHGLPIGRRQVRLTWPWRCDVHYDGFRLIVELDGRHHLLRVLTDLDRDNEHALRDEATLRYGSVHVRGRSCRVAWQVGGGLQARGWLGEPTRCAGCPDPPQCRAWLGR